MLGGVRAGRSTAADAGATLRAGRAVSAEAGRAAYDAIVRAVADAQRGASTAIATAPINKEAFRLAGLPWNGHTDLLAHLTGAAHVAMMFYSDALRVVLATVHVPLADVPRAADARADGATIELTARELPRFGDRAAADRRRRPQPARRRARPVRPRGRDGDRAGDRVRAARAASTSSGPFPADTHVRPRPARRVRRRRRLLSRSGADSGEAAGVRPGGERDARPADHPDVGRSRHGVRHRRARASPIPRA